MSRKGQPLPQRPPLRDASSAASLWEMQGRAGQADGAARDGLSDTVLEKCLFLCQTANRFQKKLEKQEPFNLNKETERRQEHSVCSNPESESTQTDRKKTFCAQTTTLPA